MIETLSLIEKKVLNVLNTQDLTIEELSELSSLNPDSVQRAVSWLKDKGLALVKEEKQELIVLTALGTESLKHGLLESRLVQALKELGGSAKIQDLQNKTGFKQEFQIALGFAKRNAWVGLIKKDSGLVIELTGLEEETLKTGHVLENALTDVKENKNLSPETLKELISRNLVEKKLKTVRLVSITDFGLKEKRDLKIEEEHNFLSSDLIKSGKWKKIKLRKFNVSEPAPPLTMGKIHPYNQFLFAVRKKLVALGFQEVQSRNIELEFYNFDVLFQPQNHSARNWTDTYQLKNPSLGSLPDKKTVNLIKNSHENGGKTSSKGWQYKWNESIASKLMPVAHTTASSAKTLVEGASVPGKYFILDRVFRPDVLDATHNLEFNQLDGFVVDESINFRTLLGILKEFALEFAGAEKVKFFPDYYPFTEPSVQVSAKHPELGWVELGGAGIFRPEFTENLGYKENVMAWGLGIDRLAMFKLNTKDIRNLFSYDISWLRESKLVEEF
ncbi:MAG: phenylalanine--tRNA ligase subunit alpha [archaeon]